MKLQSIWHLPLSVFFASALVGCASDEANRYYSTEKYAAKDPVSVMIFWEPPGRSYKVIADFQSRGETPKDMQKKAADIGADAVIVSLLGGDYSRSEKWASEDRYSMTYSRIAATAIKFD